MMTRSLSRCADVSTARMTAGSGIDTVDGVRVMERTRTAGASGTAGSSGASDPAGRGSRTWARSGQRAPGIRSAPTSRSTPPLAGSTSMRMQRCARACARIAKAAARTEAPEPAGAGVVMTVRDRADEVDGSEASRTRMRGWAGRGERVRDIERPSRAVDKHLHLRDPPGDMCSPAGRVDSRRPAGGESPQGRADPARQPCNGPSSPRR